MACAVFINNITATFYSMENVWATPFEVVHNEPFPDSSIVVPFGCGVLVLLQKDDQEKFQSRCALMIFVHYAAHHPLYTYAVYSPRTKRILYRQDCIFLTNVFPMRTARSQNGLGIEGDVIVPYRAPQSMRESEDTSLSFEGWNVDQPLPDYQDHVTGHNLVALSVSQEAFPESARQVSHYIQPNNPKFGPPSTVKVPRYRRNMLEDESHSNSAEVIGDMTNMVGEKPESARPHRQGGKDKASTIPGKRRPVKDRWYYQPVNDAGMALVSKSALQEEGATSTFQTEFDSMRVAPHPEHDHVVPKEVNMLSPFPPSVSGEFELLSPTEVDRFSHDEHGACALQGILFHDAELEWCRITGWGLECSIVLIFYSPVDAVDTV